MQIKALNIKPLEFLQSSLLFLAGISVIALHLLGGKAHAATDSVSNITIKPIISIDNFLTFDSKQYLLIDVRDMEQYKLGHLKDAVHISIEQTFNQSGDLSRIAPTHQVQTLLSETGVKNSDYIIIYDNGDLKNAAHLYWLLETYEHKKVSVLAGGYPAWINNKGAVTVNISKRPTSNYIASISSNSLATKLSTRLAIGNIDAIILDSRSRQEYIGLTSKARRKGHVPQSINIPWTDNFYETAEGNVIKSKIELMDLYNSINKKKEIIAYCNRGKQSAVTYLILRNLGYKISIYDGGWLEWGNDPALPINKMKN